MPAVRHRKSDGCRVAVLLARDVHRRGMEVDRVPSEFAYLGSPEAMPVGDEDHGGVPVAVTITPSWPRSNSQSGSRLNAPASGKRRWDGVPWQLLAFRRLALLGQGVKEEAGGASEPHYQNTSAQMVYCLKICWLRCTSHARHARYPTGLGLDQLAAWQLPSSPGTNEDYG